MALRPQRRRRPDERLARVGLARAAARRGPDIGALLGAVAVFFLFAYTRAAVHWLGDLGIASQLDRRPRSTASSPSRSRC